MQNLTGISGLSGCESGLRLLRPGGLRPALDGLIARFEGLRVNLEGLIAGPPLDKFDNS